MPRDTYFKNAAKKKAKRKRKPGPTDAQSKNPGGKSGYAFQDNYAAGPNNPRPRYEPWPQKPSKRHRSYRET